MMKMKINYKVVLFLGEVLAVAAMRAIYMLRRDRVQLPRSGKVDKLHGRPVYRPHQREEPPAPPEIEPIAGVYRPPPKE